MDEIKSSILSMLPKQASITKIEFEGPEVAIYSNNPKVLVNNGDLVKDIAKKIRKRIVVRSEPTARLSKEKTIKAIKEIVPEGAEIKDIVFDDNLGEVIIEAIKPGLVIGKNGVNLHEIARRTLWRPKVIRAPPLASMTISYLRGFYQKYSMHRDQYIKRIGLRIHRPVVINDETIRITTLGGFREVGRSALLLSTGESNILIDCGINVGAPDPLRMFPRFDFPEFSISNLDAVVISHAHLDHSGYLPYLYKYGYNGPVYATPPTRDLMFLLQKDYLEIAEKEGKLAPYSMKDIKKEMLHVITLNYGEVTDIAPDIKLTFHNAGHIVGSAIPHLHIGEGLHNIVYGADFKFAKTNLLNPANTSFPRVETLFMESTYGAPQDVVPSRKESEAMLRRIINKVIKENGKILIPVLGVGRAQEIMLTIEKLTKNREIPEIPVYIDGMIAEANAITTCHPEFLSKRVQEKIFHTGENPFTAEIFHNVTSQDMRKEIIEGESCIILATSGMLTGGPSLYYFNQLRHDKRNAIVFVSYQAEGTLGKRVQKGIRQIPYITQGKTEIIELKLQVYSISGFTGHSDRRELINYIKKITPKPEQVILMHGEESKALALANAIYDAIKIRTIVPPIGTTLRLK